MCYIQRTLDNECVVSCFLECNMDSRKCGLGIVQCATCAADMKELGLCVDDTKLWKSTKIVVKRR